MKRRGMKIGKQTWLRWYLEKSKHDEWWKINISLLHNTSTPEERQRRNMEDWKR